MPFGAGQGYDATLKYLGYQNGFLYFKVTGWQIIVAIRNEAIGGKFDVYFFINGSTTPIFFDRGPAYDVRQ